MSSNGASLPSWNAIKTLIDDRETNFLRELEAKIQKNTDKSDRDMSYHERKHLMSQLENDRNQIVKNSFGRKRARLEYVIPNISRPQSDETSIITRSLLNLPPTFDHNISKESYTCSECNKLLIVDNIESTSICRSCGLTFANIDFLEPEGIRIKKKDIEYERAPLYSKYLQQFSSFVMGQVPQEILETIFNQLYASHLLNRQRIKPTPIISMLKTNKLNDYVPFAYKISKIMNREEMVYLSDEIIQKLNRRFVVLTSLFKNTVQETGKFLSFEFLTRQFLLMEGEKSLANNFSIHKTKQVLLRAEQRLEKYCKLLNSPSQPWFVTYYR
jgi:hypothetical protein